MKIGIVSDSESFIPAAYTLAASGLQVYLYYQPSPDPIVNQKIRGFFKNSGIPVTEEKRPNFDLYKWLIGNNFNLCFVIGYKSKIQLEKLYLCKTPIFNIHFGALPYFRGPAPIFWQLKYGVEKIAVTIHRITERLDDGPIVWIKETENLPYYNFRSANQILSRMSVEGILFIVQQTINHSEILTIDKSNCAIGYQKRPSLENVVIDWQTMEAIEIGNLIRACNPWNKGAITFFKGNEIKLMDAIIFDSRIKNKTSLTPGTILECEDKLIVQCINDQTLQINMVFYDEMFIPGYQCNCYGFLRGNTFEVYKKNIS